MHQFSIKKAISDKNFLKKIRKQESLYGDGKFRTPDEFNKEKYGDNEYDRNLSFVDYWLGKIFEKINFDNTLVVLTADHPHNDTLFKNKRTENFIIKGRILGPRFYNVGKKLIKLTRIIKKQHQEMFVLPDRQIKIPLIFAGYGINNHKIITQLVRNIDIFPTIADIVGLPKKNNVDGRSLLPLFQGKELEELPIYIENKKISLEMDNSAIGVRNSNYKYYRDRNNPNSKIYLYDLKNDPDEIKNIASNSSQIVLQMEKILEEMKKNSHNEFGITLEDVK